MRGDEELQEEEYQRRNHTNIKWKKLQKRWQPRNRPCRAVAREFYAMSLSSGLLKKNLQQSNDKNVTLGCKRNRQIFTEEEDQKLSEYVKTASAIIIVGKIRKNQV